MALKSMKDLLQIAKSKNYILGAFNTYNLEMSLAIIDAAEEGDYPIIMQISPHGMLLSGYDYMSSIMKICAQKAKVPVCIHLDHGKSLEDVKKAVQCGFNSVMIDGSMLPFEQNIELTRKAADYCHPLGISVEAELGMITGKEDAENQEKVCVTDYRLVKQFCEESKCDLLAVSIGNIHGLNKKAELDLELLKNIHSQTQTPLVIHGGSGIPVDTLREFKKYGVMKLNISSDLQKAFISTVGEMYQNNHNEHSIMAVSTKAKENIKKAVISKFKALYV